MEINKIYNESNLETMAKMPDCFIDLTVTSPPYDNLREYNGYSFPFEEIAKELFRVTKIGGVVVWVVGDATINGSETCTSFKQALFFMQCGFNLHDTMIYKKGSGGAVGSNLSYWQSFEYMFVFSKGKIKTVNRIKDKKNINIGGVKTEVQKTVKIKSRMCHKDIVTQEYGFRDNIWEYAIGFANTDDSTDHPAVFPEKLAADHIYTWSNEGDLVYDCFCGSGTTPKMANAYKRNWIGSEISSEYVELANKRLDQYLRQQTLF